MTVDPLADFVVEIVRLRVALDRATAATEMMLTAQLSVPVHLSAPEDDRPGSPVAEREELCRQLAALRDRVSRAQDESGNPRALRAELATLLFFARTLQADADGWRATLKDRIEQLERQRTAERQERERLAAKRAELVRRRDVLKLTITQTAARLAQQSGGECRRTLPVFSLGEGLTVCSVAVSSSRRGFRRAKRWLVTLNSTRDGVLVKRE